LTNQKSSPICEAWEIAPEQHCHGRQEENGDVADAPKSSH